MAKLQETGIKGIDEYCQGVRSGKISVCSWVRKAVDRHYRDLARQDTDDFPYRFSSEHAMHFFDFCGSLKHYQGKWAGQPLELRPWQQFIYGSVYGWLHVDTGYRRFHEVHVEIPKKNGKTLLGGAIALYGILADGEAGAQIYCLATNRMQAMKLAYQAAVEMVENNEQLKELVKINKGIATMGIVYPDTSSFFEPLTSKPKSIDGFNPSGAINDEIKDWEDLNVYDLIEDGVATRTQPLLYNVTTAGDNRKSLGYVKREYTIKILDEVLADEQFFGIIYTIDEEDVENWDSEDVWRKANPNFGVSIQHHYFEKQVKAGNQNQRKKNDVLTKNLNVWISAFEQWMDSEAWKACGDTDLSIDQVSHLPCVIALDLASKVDVAAMVLMFYDEQAEQFYFFLRSYLPADNIAQASEKKSAKRLAWEKEYRAWADEGWMTLTDGSMINQEAIKDDLIEACGLYDVQRIAYDPHQATKLITELQEEGLPVLEYRHTVLNMSEPMKELEAKVISGAAHHRNNPVLTWMMSNVVAKEDVKENIYPRKKDTDDKIDGPVGMIMCMGTYLFVLGTDEEEENMSPYARRARNQQTEQPA